MSAALEHRGPDSQGVYVGAGIALGHRRLSIIDRSNGGSQPMSSKNERYVLVYNGELYNFKELRHELIDSGVQFTSESDTEVVLNSIIEWGIEKACKKFNGMFALAIWDTVQKTLHLSRDRFGIKPLYWTITGNSLIFGSEIKALACSEQFSRRLNYDGLSEYLYYGNAMAEKTLFDSCQKLQPGHTLKVTLNNQIPKPTIVAWWSLADIPSAPTAQGKELVELVRSELELAVKRHLIADVPVALFLSGGLDSSSICALASKSYSGTLKTISVEFGGTTANSELDAARLVANTYGTNHEERRLDFDNLVDVVEDIGRAHDQPFGDAANIPLYIISKDIASEAKVVLQGDGGDEIFGGYKRYRLLQQLPFWRANAHLLPTPKFLAHHSPTARRLRRMQDALGRSKGAIQFAKLLTEEWDDGGIGQLVNAQTKQKLSSTDAFAAYKNIYPQVKHLDAAQAMLWIDTQILLPDFFLEKVDRSTMANSIEVRVPFLDTSLTDLLMSVPSSQKLKGSSKSLLRDAMKGVLPEQILTGPKLGFGVPYGEWLAGPLADYTRERLTQPNSLMTALFKKDELNKLCDRHMKEGKNHGFMLYKLLMLSIWAEQYKVT